MRLYHGSSVFIDKIDMSLRIARTGQGRISTIMMSFMDR